MDHPQPAFFITKISTQNSRSFPGLRAGLYDPAGVYRWTPSNLKHNLEWRSKNMKRMIGYLLVAMFILNPVLAEDWPEWRGKGRSGIWTESGILDKFPEKGLTVAWRTPIHGGFAGPAVAAGRVFVTDFKRSAGKKGIERALCLDEKSGRVLWAREWDADYQGISYDNGPRATPTVDGDRVYVLGASGKLFCLNVRTGAVIWQKDYVKDYGTQMPAWGISSAPLLLAAAVPGQPGHVADDAGHQRIAPAGFLLL
jgi:outer membrane protein assembly factor BamB